MAVNMEDSSQESSAEDGSKSGKPSKPIVNFTWADQAHAQACVNTLVEALTNDPINSYFSGKRSATFVKDEIVGYFKALPKAHHFIATPDSAAVALWQLMPLETPRNELFAGWQRIFKVPMKLWISLFSLELAYEKFHEEAFKKYGEYYYLSFIATRAECRGKGYGSLLLKHITNKADDENRICLLEATSERSRDLYGRHGFEVVEMYRVRPDAPPSFFMLRKPKSGGVGTDALVAHVAGKVQLSNAGTGPQVEDFTIPAVKVDVHACETEPPILVPVLA